MKKLVKLCTAFLVLFAVLTVSALAAEVLHSGTCGSNVTWTLDDEGALRIEGNGEMGSYWSGSPWYNYRSSIKSAVIGEGVTSIGNSAFSECSSLTSVTITESVTSMGQAAFSDCISLVSVVVPEGVTSIGNSAFNGCSSLVSITVDENNAKYSSDERGVLFNKDKTTLIRYPIGNTATSYEIPSSVTSIGGGAFSDCSSLTSVTIPEGVTSIGNSAFSGCSSLKLVTIPEGVISIGWSAFSGCSSLTSVTIPEGATSIGDSAFYNCSSLTSVNIPESVTSVGDGVFFCCRSLTGITVDENNAKYSSDERGVLFNKDKTTLIQYPIGNTSQSYEIPEGVTHIGDGAFWNCRSLILVNTLPSVTSIGNSAFRDCSSLTSVNIPESVMRIGYYAFSGCSSLKSVYISDLEAWCKIKFNGYDSNPLCNGSDLYINEKKATNIEILDGVVSICNYAFYGCSTLTSVTIPTSVTSIGSSCFQNSVLKDIYYTGVKSQFVRINIATNNSTFNQATVHYQGVAVTGVSLNRTSLTLMQGESAQLIATVLPANASDKTVTWSVTNPNVASVAEGVVSALNAGKTEIKVTTADGGFTAVCTVTVTAPPTILNRDTVLILDDSYSMNGTPLTELKKAAIKFCKNVLEANGNNRIALVIYEAGTTVYDFTTDITSLTASINAMRGYGNYTNTNYALQKANALIAKSNADVKSVVLMTDGVPTCGDSDVKTAAAAVRSHATLFTLGFFHNISGSNKTRAQQLLQAIKSEEYYYEVKDGSKLDESFFEISEAITKIPVTGLSLDKEKIVLTEGESLMLNASLEPHDTTERKIYWSSSNTAVATVSENGTVTAVSEGSVTVTAVSANTEIKAECTVIVNSSEAWYYTYTVKDDGTAEITGYRTGLQGDIVIPSYVHEYRVTSIGDRTFFNCSNLTSVIIPVGVTSISDHAFYGCSNLASVTIPKGMTNIGNYVFYCCSSLMSVTIPASVTSIGSSAFSGCSSLTSVSIPESVTSISGYVFHGCKSLTSVIIPEGVTSIGDYAFSDCSSLTSVSIPKSVMGIGEDAFSFCRNLASVTIPANVTSIRSKAFYCCSSLTSVTIPKGVMGIGEDAFRGCSSLTNITVDENNAKYSSDERGVLFDKDKTTLIQYPIGNTATSYEIPSSATGIGNGAFSGCSSLTSVVILEGVTSIGISAFYDCSSLTSVTIPKSVTSIGDYAFYNCDNLKDVYYLGTEEEWKNISIGQYNYYLTRATIHYNATILTPSVTRTADGTVYKVSAANLPVSSVVVVALYKDGRFVGYESAVYNGETLEIAADTPHDTATILAWSDLEKLIPLAPGTKIGS